MEQCKLFPRFRKNMRTHTLNLFLFCLASHNTNLKFYTTPAGSYTLATGDQFYLNCTVGGR